MNVRVYFSSNQNPDKVLVEIQDWFGDTGPTSGNKTLELSIFEALCLRRALDELLDSAAG